MKNLIALVLILSLIFVFKCTDKNEYYLLNLKKYDIKFEDNIVTVPDDATIIYQGQIYQGSAQIPEDQFIGIIKDNQAYLYYTSMGNSNLTKETSRKAIGYLLFSKNSPINKIDLSISDFNLSTGINVVAEGSQYKFTNLKKRFAAIEHKNNAKYLAQRGDLLEINLIGALSGENLIEVLQTDNISFIVNDIVKTYGASIRIINIPFLWPVFVQKNKDAITNGANQTILANVNIIDFLYITINSIKVIINGFPVPLIDCWLAYVSNTFLSTAGNVMIDLITHDDHLSKQNWTAFTNDLFTDFFDCLLETGVVASGNAIALAIKETLEIIGSLSWIIDNNLVSDFDILTTSTFVTWNPPESITGNISGKITDALNHNPIPGATITTQPQTSNVTTNASGNYTIDNVTPGNYMITASKYGYRNATKSIVVQPNETTTANLSMIPESVAGACKNVPYWFALGTTVDGQDAHGAEGDFSCYSDVYTTGGVRISPWLGDGRAYYNYGDATGRGNVTVTIQWVDNGWWDGDKAIEIYNWNQNKWDRITTWRGNDCQEHYSTYSIPLSTERINEGKISVAVWSSGDSVIHLRTIKVY